MNAAFFIEIEEPTSDAEAIDRAKKGKGKIKIAANLSERVGGLSRFKRRTAFHEHVAMLFKAKYERTYGAALGATDHTHEYVDKSLTAHDMGMAQIIDQSADLRQAMARLANSEWQILVRVIVLQDLETDLATRYKQKQERKDIQDQLFAALGHLGEIWGLKK